MNQTDIDRTLKYLRGIKHPRDKEIRLIAMLEARDFDSHLFDVAYKIVSEGYNWGDRMTAPDFVIVGKMSRPRRFDRLITWYELKTGRMWRHSWF